MKRQADQFQAIAGQAMKRDSTQSQRRKREGMDRAAKNRADALSYCVRLALEIGQETGTCHSDQVFYQMHHSYRDLAWKDLGNAAGSIFKGKEWKWTGKMVASKRPNAHGRMIKVWRYVGTDQQTDLFR